MRTKIFVCVFLLTLGMGSVLAETAIPNIPINTAEQARPADDPESALEPVTLGAPTALNGTTASHETAFARELAELRTRQLAQLAELNQRLRQTADPQQELTLQLELDAVKQEGEIELLGLQIRHAQAAGRTEVVEKLQQAIDQITSPQPVIEPQERPASGRTNP